MASKFSVALVGGDLAAGRLFAADIVVVGVAPRGRALRRSGARPGDILYVSGLLGGSALGLDRLRQGRTPRDLAIRRHLYPQPRLDLAARLLGSRATSAMDLSDGLSLDLYRLTRESGVGAEVIAGAVPRFPGASLEQALHGGEDYELLFTLPPGRRPPPGCHTVGAIIPRRQLILIRPDGRRVRLPVRGFTHRV